MKKLEIQVIRSIYLRKISLKVPESAESKEKSNWRFLRFLFFELWYFLRHHQLNFRWIFHDDSENKNRRMFLLFFSFYSEHSATSVKTGSKLRERGIGGGGEEVCISFVGRRSTYELDYCIFSDLKKKKLILVSTFM